MPLTCLSLWSLQTPSFLFVPQLSSCPPHFYFMLKMNFFGAIVSALLLAASAVPSAHAQCAVDKCPYVDTLSGIQKYGQRMCTLADRKYYRVENVCAAPRMVRQLIKKGGKCGCCNFSNPIDQVTNTLNTAACPLTCAGDNACSMGKSTSGHFVCRSLKNSETGYARYETQVRD